jgi:hypothetical protein
MWTKVLVLIHSIVIDFKRLKFIKEKIVQIIILVILIVIFTLTILNFLITIIGLGMWIALNNNILLLATNNQFTIFYFLRGFGVLLVFLYIKALVNYETYFKAESLYYSLPSLVLFALHIYKRVTETIIVNFSEVLGMKFIPEWKTFYSTEGVLYILFRLMIYTYLFLSWRLFILYLKNRTKKNQQDLILKWGLAFLILKTLGVILTNLKSFALQYQYQTLHNITTLFISAFALIGATYVFYHPEMILNLSRINVDKKKKAPNILNEDVVELYCQINLLMQQEKFYLNSVFNISNFAAHNQIPIAKIKLTIVENGYSSFSNYVNSFRIKHAEDLIKENYLNVYFLFNKTCRLFFISKLLLTVLTTPLRRS